jgi:Fe-S-cluster-containing hydrogenase component 2
MIPRINNELCTGCGSCLEVCPPEALTMRDDKAFLEEEFCEECGFCAPQCPVSAIEITFPVSDKR